MSCCKEYSQRISEFLDGALEENEQRLLLEHMESCENCRAYLGELAAMHEALAGLDEVEVPEGFRAGVMNAVRGKKRAKKALIWKRYAAAAACAAIVLVGAGRLMPDFGAKSAAPESAAMESGAVMEAAEAPSAAGGAVEVYQNARCEEKAFSYLSDTAAEEEAPMMPEPEEGEAALPTVRGENALETLLALGAVQEDDTLLVAVEILKNLPEGLTLEGEFDENAELVSVLFEEVAA